MSASSFGERLQQVRLDRGLTQAKLASLIGVQPTVISHYETGHQEPSLQNFARLVLALGASADYLIASLDTRRKAGVKA